jgi:uncharacterized protein YjiS (DUF1127 family)
MHLRTNSAACVNLIGGVPRQGAFSSWSVPFMPAARSSLANAEKILCEWRRRSHSRAELRSLSRRDIADFCPGFEVIQEASKPFWRA